MSAVGNNQSRQFSAKSNLQSQMSFNVRSNNMMAKIVVLGLDSCTEFPSRSGIHQEMRQYITDEFISIATKRNSIYEFGNNEKDENYFEIFYKNF